MDGDQVERSEIVLEQGPPFWLGRIMWAGAFVLLCWMTISGNGRLPAWNDPFWLVTLVFCGVSLVLRFRFGRDIQWSIRPDEIGIDADNDSFRLVRRGDIQEIEILAQPRIFGGGFRIRLWLASGRRPQSPLLASAQRAQELKAEIARRLDVTDT
jgi:hypothetical protein